MLQGKYIHMKIFSIIFIAAVIMISFIPCVSVSNDAYHSSCGRNGTTPYTSGNRIYLYSNLTINSTDALIGIDHELCFPGHGSYWVHIDSNIDFSHETIFSARGNITIVNGKQSDNDAFNCVHLQMNGTLYLSQATVSFTNSTLGSRSSHLSLRFQDDNLTAYNTMFNGAKQLNPSSFPTSYASNDGQPISAIQCCQLTFSREKYFTYPVTSLCECLNYTLSGRPVNAYTNFTLNHKNFTMIDPVTNEHRISKFILNVTAPIYITHRSDEPIYANFSFPYGTQLTIWNYTLNMISNSTLNFTGFSHNYMMLNHTTLLASNSTFTGNSLPFMSDGMLNMKKTGMILCNESLVMFTGSNFSHTTGINDPPVIIHGGSTFYYIPIMKIMYLSLNRNHFLRDRGLIGNSTVDRGVKTYLDMNQGFFEHLNYSYLMGAYELSKRDILQNVFPYSIYNYSSYVSITKTSLLHTKFLNIEKIFHNTSSIVINPVSLHRSGINVSYAFNISYTVFSDTSLRINITQSIQGNVNTFHYRRNFQHVESTLHLNRTFVDEQNHGYIVLNISLQYYNGFREITSWENCTFALPTLNYTYHLEAEGLPSHLEFSVHENNETLRSSGQVIIFSDAKDNLTISIAESGYYNPNVTCMNIHSGTTYILFHKEMGLLYVYTEGLSSTHMTVDNSKKETGNAERFYLPYGNYTLTVNSTQEKISLNVSIVSPDTSVSIATHSLANIYNQFQEFIPIFILSLVVAGLYNYARVKYRRICRVCLVPVKLGEKHVHKKKIS